MGKQFEEDVEDEDLFVTLSLDNDVTCECKVLTIFEADEQDYIVLLPLNEDGSEPDESDVYIYRYYEDENGDPHMENIESDEEFEIVSDRFDEFLDELAYRDMNGEE